MRQAEIEFIEKVKAARANKDGTRRYEVFHIGQKITVPLASANFRVERGQAKILKFIDVDASGGESIVDVPVEVVQDSVEPVQNVIDIIRFTREAIVSLDIAKAKSAFSQLRMSTFDAFVEEYDITADSRLVIAAAIEEYSETEDIVTINIGDLKDALEDVIKAVS